MLQNVVIVGASLAGLRAAETLRTRGFDGRLTVVGAEPHPPYDRPPLSKKVLAGEWAEERTALRKPAQYEPLGIEFRLGVRATGLDPAARTVTLGDGEVLTYDGLVLATGAAPRRIAGWPALDGIHTLRTLEDSRALSAAFAASPRRVVVVGGGFLGAEIAATARGRGLAVTIVETLPGILARGVGARIGGALGAVHEDNGVDLRLSSGVAALHGTTQVEAVELTDGTRLDADAVVIAIGVHPATGWLEGSGLTIRDGIVCDATLAAGPPGVFAAGDVARWPHPRYGEELRIEHWTNAAEQGAAAAANLLATSAGGTGEPFGTVPFVWSDQYDARVQLLGRMTADDDIDIVHGSPQERRFVALASRNGRVRGVLGLTMPKLVMPFRPLLLDGATRADALAFARTQQS